MAVGENEQPTRQSGTNNSGESEAAARLAPLEEKTGTRAQQSSAHDGTLILNTGELKLPQELTEEEETAQGILPLDPYVLAVLCFTIVFILSIAYVIWSGWEPPR